MNKLPIKLNELPYDGEFLNALGELEHRIIEDYERFTTRGGKKEMSPISLAMFEDFKNGLGYLPGTKYLKVVTENSLWGFINLKNTNFKEGSFMYQGADVAGHIYPVQVSVFRHPILCKRHL